MVLDLFITKGNQSKIIAETDTFVNKQETTPTQR
jgi:hypothetical protein